MPCRPHVWRPPPTANPISAVAPAGGRCPHIFAGSRAERRRVETDGIRAGPANKSWKMSGRPRGKYGRQHHPPPRRVSRQILPPRPHPTAHAPAARPRKSTETKDQNRNTIHIVDGCPQARRPHASSRMLALRYPAPRTPTRPHADSAATSLFPKQRLRGSWTTARHSPQQHARGRATRERVSSIPPRCRVVASEATLRVPTACVFGQRGGWGVV